MDEQAIKELVQEFCDKLGIVVDDIEPLTVASNNIFNIRTNDSKRMIGAQGDHLRALNYVVRRYAERKFDSREYRFLVDVNGYQLSRIRDLEQKAKMLADRVRTFRSSAEMTPMNAYERMIIHSLFSEDEEIETGSEGFGKTRHVVLKYKNQ